MDEIELPNQIVASEAGELENISAAPKSQKKIIFLIALIIILLSSVTGFYVFNKILRPGNLTTVKPSDVPVIINESNLPASIPTDSAINGSNVYLTILGTSVNGKTIAYTITDVPNKSIEFFANGLSLNKFSSNIEVPRLTKSLISEDGSLVSYNIDITNKLVDVANPDGTGTITRDFITYINQNKTKAYADSFSFLPHSNQYGYIEAGDGGNMRKAVINGQIGKTYDYIWQIIYSEDRQHYYYVARIKDKDNLAEPEKDVVIKDGNELGPCWLNCILVTSPNRQHIAFYGSENPSQLFSDFLMTVDDQQIKLPRANGRNSIFGLTLSDNGDYAYQFSKDLDAIQDKIETDLYLNTQKVFSTSGSRTRGSVGIKNNSIKIIDSEHVFFALEDSNTKTVAYYINDKNISGWVSTDKISEPVFDESGKNAYYAVLDTSRKIAKLMRNDTQFSVQPIFPSGPWFISDIIRVVPNSSQIFFYNTDNNNKISVIDTQNGQVTDSFEASNLTELWFSPNNESYCWIYQGNLYIKGNQLIAKSVVGTPRYIDDNTLSYFVKQDGLLSKAVYKIAN